MCIEHFTELMSRHNTVRCPSEPIEDGGFLRFFSVDLSRRKAVLLRGGPLRKGLGGIITYTSVPLHHFSSASMEHRSFSLVYAKMKASKCCRFCGVR